MKYLRLFSIVALMCVCGTSFASHETISAKIGDKDGNTNLVVAPGGTVDAYLFMTNTDASLKLKAFMTVGFNLPEGFSLAGKPELIADRWDFDLSTETITYNKIKKITFYNLDEDYGNNCFVKGSSGPIIKFQLQAAADVAASETPYECSLFKFYIANENGEENYVVNDDVETEAVPFTITVGAAATAEDITLANEWNTYCSTNDLNFSSIEGVEAYVVSDVTATSAKLEAVTVVPAGVGFLIKGTAEQKISVPFAESAGSVTSKLVGVTEDTPLEGGNYVLSGDQFVLCSEGGTLPAHKAYLPGGSVTSGAKAFGFDFGDATGINEAKAAKADGAIYSISGVRVAQPQKGVYIMNGRKVIVK